MLANDDVIDLMGQMGIFLVLMGQMGIFLVQQAVLASVADTFGDPIAGCCQEEVLKFGRS